MPKIACCAITLLLCSVHAHSFQVDTSSKTYYLPAVETTAYRAQDTDPITQSTLSRQNLDRLAVGQDPQFFLERLTPSIIAFSESGSGVSNYGSFRLRGMDQTRVNVTIDGVPVNDMIDQGVFFSNIGDLTNGMNSIQVQRGVGMSSNGTAAYAGSVDFETAQMWDILPKATIQLGMGSFGLTRASAGIHTGQLPGGFSAVARLTSLSANGYRNHTGTDATSALFKIGWKSEKTVADLTALWGGTSNQLGYFPVPKPLADSDPRTNLNDSSDTDDFGQFLIKLRTTHAFNSSLLLDATLYYGGAGGDYFTGYRDTQQVLTLVNYPLENRHIGGFATITAVNVIDGLDISGGIHAYTFRRRNWETIVPEVARPYYDDRTTKNDVSVTTRAQYRINNFEAFVDLQARSVNLQFAPDSRTDSAGTPSRSWLFVNPRIGFTVHLMPSTDIYASFGRTGREPTRFDLLGGTQISSANIPVLQDQSRVRPEFANDFELGTRTSGLWYSVKSNFFYMAFTDEIAPIGPYIEQQFVQLRKNIESSSRLGFEFEADLTPLPNLQLGINAALTHAVVDRFSPDNTADTITYNRVTPILTPPVIANMYASYSVSDLFDVSIAMRFVSESFTDLTNNPSLILPSFWQLDSRIWFNVGGGSRIGFFANNILNAFIVTSGGSAHFNGAMVPTYFVQAQRTWSAILDIRL